MAPRSRGAEITPSGLRSLLGVLSLTALGALLVIGLWLRVVGVLAWAFAATFVPEARRWSLDARRHR